MDYFLKSGKIEKTQGRKVCLLYGDFGIWIKNWEM
jgi:hypothetical protein